MAPRYISGIILRLLETIVEEVAAERGIGLPPDKPVIHEIGWILHGAVSHLAIRRHLFHANLTVPVDSCSTRRSRAFLAGFEPMLDTETWGRHKPAGEEDESASAAGQGLSRQLTSRPAMIGFAGPGAPRRRDIRPRRHCVRL
jgi:hypothetical protein